MNGIRYSKEIRDRAISLYQSGLSAATVASRLALKTYTVKEWITAAGLVRTMSEAAALSIRDGKLRGFPRQHLSYTSTKTGDTHWADSRWEVARMIQLDADPSIIDWDRCRDQIAYITVSGKKRHYVPDFVVTRVDGGLSVEEIKPQIRLNDDTNKRKVEEAGRFYGERGVSFCIITEQELFGTLKNLKAVVARPYDGKRTKELRRQRLARETPDQAKARRDANATRTRVKRHVSAITPIVNGLMSFGA